MARRNSKDVRFNSLPQRQQRRLERKKRRGNPMRDGTDWTDKLLNKMKAAEQNDD